MKLSDKIALVRVDFNVPMENGVVMDDIRLRVPLETVHNLKKQGVKVVLMSHLGKFDINGTQSLRQLVPNLEQIYGCSVLFIENYLRKDLRSVINQTDDLILLENLRMHPQEEACDIEFARQLASIGDFYINEAFSVSHRRHASVFGVPKFLPSYLGKKFKEEINNIEKFFNHQVGKKMAIIGGSKLSTKLKLLKRLVTKVDKLALGGGISGAFLSCLENNPLHLNVQKEYIDDVKEIVSTAKASNCDLVFPLDFSALISTNHDHTLITSEGSNNSESTTSVFDIGPESVELLKKHIIDSNMVLWNGPVGLFERSPFEFGTKAIAEFIAQRTQENQLVSIIGGGDTGFAMKKFNVADKMSCISTAGGAFLNYIENEDCPALEGIRCSRKKFPETSESFSC